MTGKGYACWLTVLLSCAGWVAAEAQPEAPPGPAIAPSTAVIGMEVKIRGPLSFPTYSADIVYFVRKCDGEDDCNGALIPSTFAKKGRAYLVGAKPGNYVAVAALFQVLNTQDRYVAYFPTAMIDATATQVSEGDARHLVGSFVLGTSIGLCRESAEPQQLDYAELIDPGSVKCGMAGTVMDKIARSNPVIVGGIAVPTGGPVYHYRGLAKEAHRGPADLERLEGLAEADLAGYRGRN